MMKTNIFPEQKKIIMNPQNINLEILLFSCSSFAGQELCNLITESKSGSFISANEKLEKACRDSMPGVLLPEIVISNLPINKYYLWQITSADNFLCLNLGACDITIMGESSIDPCYFNTSHSLN